MIRDKGKTTITAIVATPVAVPVRDWADAVPEAQGAKYILRAGTNRGLVGLGETVGGVTEAELRRSARSLVGVMFSELQRNWLPIPMNRVYGAFELVVYDILGRAFGVPVHQLLGGQSHKRVCCRALLAGSTAEQIGRSAGAAVKQGFQAGVFEGRGVPIGEALKAIREQAGSTFDIILRAGGLCDGVDTARQLLAQIAAYHVIVVEDLLSMEQADGYPAMRSERGPQFALSLSLSKHPVRFQTMMRQAMRANVDGLLLDAPMATSMHIAGVGHVMGQRCGLAGGLDLGLLEVARLHVAAASPGCVWYHDITGRFVREHDLLRRSLLIDAGEASVPTGPGLGVELSIDALERYRAGEDVELARV